MTRSIRRAAVLGAVLTIVAAACSSTGGGTTSSATASGPAPTGSTSATPSQQLDTQAVLRIGTINDIDSFNPFNYIETQAYQAMIMLYPQLVQYDHGPDGYTIVGDW